jgi:tRNA threonylcarbamoyladenosine biosynthesis protein TsaE
MSDFTFEVKDLHGTRRFGQTLGSLLRTEQIIALVGPLGSGKTTLVKAVAIGAGVENERVVNSPTFVLVNEYEATRRDHPLHLYHIDVYRLRGSTDLEALGFDEMCTFGAVLIEWAERVEDVLPPDRLHVEIIPLDEQGRRFTCRATGPRSIKLLDELKKQQSECSDDSIS